jgi:hypothetical protein
MEYLDNTATHKYIFECFSLEDFNKLLHLFEDPNFIETIKNNINDQSISLNINIIDKSGIFINVLKNDRDYFHISFHLFPKDLRQNSESEGLFHIKNNRNKSVTRLRINKVCNITNKNKKTLILSIGHNPNRKESVSKKQKIITQKILDVINTYFNSELNQYFRKIQPSQNHILLPSLTTHIKQNPYLNRLSPKNIRQTQSNSKGLKQSSLWLKGGACGCQQIPKLPTPLGGGYKARSAKYTSKRGGYKPTKRNLKYLKLWKKGKSIGFTMRSSLKAKGLIPRSNGTKRVSPKYRK